MTFEGDLKNFSKSITLKKRGITTEETTKLALVLPFLKILGYDVENPHEVKAEYSADVGVKKSEKIDLAILIDGAVQMFVESKSANIQLNSNHTTQLFRYYSVSNVKLAILTNGIVWKFFTDSENSGRMDSEAFLEIDLRNLSDRDIESLKLFKKDEFSLLKINEHVEELMYRKKIKKVVIDEIQYADEDMVRLITKKVFDGVLNKKRFKYFENLVREGITEVFENGFIIDSEIVTTQEELEGFYIVRAILSEIVDPSRIVIRDRKSYCPILFDNNHNYTICRLYFNDLDNLVVSFFDSMQRDKNGSRIEENIGIDRVSDIYKYRDKLLATVREYKKVKD